MQKPNIIEARKRSKAEVSIDYFKIDESLLELGKNKKYYIKTYGCQMNEHDTENIKAILEKMSYKETSDMDEADLILLNTCAIRENAHNKVFGFLGRIKHLKSVKKGIVAGICGCMAQEEHVVNEILEKYKWLNIVFGTHNINNLPKILKEATEEEKQKIEVFSVEGSIIENMPAKRYYKYKAWVNIMYGCDKFCTYCIVPYTRGKQRSRKKEDIINEVKDLVKEGYLEVTLLGQNVNAYGKDLKESYKMENLLEEVALTGIKRVRFVTSHPWDFTDSMIEVIKKYPNIMPYIHLPLQSGSDNVLKLMNRRYTVASYLELVNKLRENIPNLSLTTDIIVGFPGETEENFNETLNVVNKCKYDSAFTFIFSKRVGTPAYDMKDDITVKEKEERLYKLNNLINKYALENNLKYKDKIVPVLIENFSDKGEDTYMGYTDTMKLVNVKSDKNIIGRIVNVKITDVKTFSMDGEIVV